MIAKINNPILRRVSLLLCLPFVTLFVLVFYVLALLVAMWDRSVDFWDGFPSGVAESFKETWNGTSE